MSAQDQPLIEARTIEKAFRATQALRGVSVAIGPGEVVAITGPSGSGKSTLLHCLAGILRPDSGEVRYAGRRIDTLDETERTLLRREHFGILFQFGGLVPELAAAENVALPLLLARHGREESMTAARSWLERLGVAECAGLRPGEMSAGQLQRVAVARALVTRPRVLFADEPTGALDTVSGEEVLALLLYAAREQGSTLVLVTHDNQIAAYADGEIFLRDGRAASEEGARSGVRP
ncbi:MAG: ATP-binding cassette domain-containing protein [Streptosporangiales bacterium]|nr:ATP-binding cassette domain-containing protein [Streptosporangiales bacterium]